jgi:hypothetical protein
VQDLRKAQKLPQKKSLIVKDHHQLLMCIVFYVYTVISQRSSACRFASSLRHMRHLYFEPLQEKVLCFQLAPEFILPVFAKTSPKRSFSITENERFVLVFAKTGYINSGLLYFIMFLSTVGCWVFVVGYHGVACRLCVCCLLLECCRLSSADFILSGAAGGGCCWLLNKDSTF